jgi:hypothetical protein
MLRAAQDAAARITAHQRPGDGGRPDDDSEPDDGGHRIGLVLADAGYLSEENLTCPGPDRLIGTGKHRDLEQAAREAAAGDPGQDTGAGQALTAMAARLKTEAGITACRQRGHIAETPHGHIKHDLAFRQLSPRGKRKATAEWTFTCAIHNLLTAISASHLTSQARAALTG